jgi:hypothetical protein
MDPKNRLVIYTITFVLGVAVLTETAPHLELPAPTAPIIVRPVAITTASMTTFNVSSVLTG